MEDERKTNLTSALTALRQVCAQVQGRKIAILGIGNTLNGDDGAGVFAARLLQKRIDETAPALKAQVQVFDTGPSPESFTGPLRRYQPGLVLMIDAAEMGEPPGGVRVFDWPEVEGMSASTHTMPPSMLAKFLTAEINCRVVLVGIQPKGLELDQLMSYKVRKTVLPLCVGLIQILLDMAPGK